MHYGTHRTELKGALLVSRYECVAAKGRSPFLERVAAKGNLGACYRRRLFRYMGHLILLKTMPLPPFTTACILARRSVKNGKVCLAR